ncbi:MAG: hypothetical protein L0Y71_21090 [Gemmataceae bacterium]|nr:hypothetical protein [Gemmataceae bacterium]
MLEGQHTPEQESRIAAEHEASEHETSDVNIRAILWFLAALALGGLVIQVAMWWLKEALVAREKAASPPPPAIVEREGLQLPRDVGKLPSPRLEADDRRELAELRAYEKRTLTSYDWVDRERGVVRIPIDRAMQLILDEGGLPARQPPAQRPKGARSKEGRQ